MEEFTEKTLLFPLPLHRKDIRGNQIIAIATNSPVRARMRKPGMKIGIELRFCDKFETPVIHPGQVGNAIFHPGLADQAATTDAVGIAGVVRRRLALQISASAIRTARCDTDNGSYPVILLYPDLVAEHGHTL